jgi:membrane protease YdiL (CAAX protease family)
METEQASAAQEQGGRPLALVSQPDQRPDRYRIREDESGKVLACLEAPTVTVRVRHGRTVTAAAARSAEPGSIFLDGAAQGPPFLDPKRPAYNLDHHEGCVRAFTLSTCEQALVLIRKLVDLRKRDWVVHANDADLDTVLAIWVLLNHLRLNDDERLRARILPLIRLEGAIDVHGLGHLDLLSLPPDSMRIARAWMDRLLEKEREIQKTVDGKEPELTDYVAERLRDIDSLVYSPSQIANLAEIEEACRIPLGEGSVAIVCRSDLGIYEAADQLRRYHGERLGMIVLQKSPSRYSLYQLDNSLRSDLDDVYVRLNLVDPAAGGTRSANRWGGSEEIGGSPRATGTRLTSGGIAAAIDHVFNPPGRTARLACTGRTVLAGLGALAAGLLGVALVFLLDLNHVSAAALLPREPALCFGATLSLICVPWLLLAGRRAPGLYGLRWPTGRAWWTFLPLALLGAACGGVWVPRDLVAAGPGPVALLLAATLALPLAGELLFRGVLMGRLAWVHPMQRPGGPVFLSVPVLTTSALFALACALPLFFDPLAAAYLPAGSMASIGSFPGAGLLTPLLPVAGGFVFALAAGMARERSESLLAPLLLHWLGALAILLAALLPSLIR